MLDLIVRGGLVVTPDGANLQDVAIAGERIAAVTVPEALKDVPAARTIDASGKLVLFGGTTTLIDFAVWNAGETLEQAITRRDDDWRGQCHCDYAFHVTLFGKIPPTTLNELPEAMQEGFPTGFATIPTIVARTLAKVA